MDPTELAAVGTAYRRGDYAALARALTPRVIANPTLAPLADSLRFHAAVACLHTGQFESAIEHLQAIRTYSIPRIAFRQLALRVFAAAGRIDEAQEYAQALARTGDRQGEAAAKRLRLARAMGALHRGEAASAVVLLEGLACNRSAQDEVSCLATRALIVAHLHQGDDTAASAVYQRCSGCGHRKNQEELEILCRLGRLREALAQLAAMDEQQLRAHALMRWHLARRLFAQGNYHALLRGHRQLLGPEVSGVVVQGIALLMSFAISKVEGHGKALRWLHQWRQQAGDSEHLAHACALHALAAGDPSRAVLELEGLRAPTPAVLRSLAFARFQMGQRDAVIEVVDRLGQPEPTLRALRALSTALNGNVEVATQDLVGVDVRGIPAGLARNVTVLEGFAAHHRGDVVGAFRRLHGTRFGAVVTIEHVRSQIDRHQERSAIVQLGEIDDPALEPLVLRTAGMALVQLAGRLARAGNISEAHRQLRRARTTCPELKGRELDVLEDFLRVRDALPASVRRDIRELRALVEDADSAPLTETARRRRVAQLCCVVATLQLQDRRAADPQALAEAQELVARARSALPEFDSARRAAGVCAAHRGAFSEALSLIGEPSPDGGVFVQDALALCYAGVGRRLEARRAWAVLVGTAADLPVWRHQVARLFRQIRAPMLRPDTGVPSGQPVDVKRLSEENPLDVCEPEQRAAILLQRLRHTSASVQESSILQRKISWIVASQAWSDFNQLESVVIEFLARQAGGK